MRLASRDHLMKFTVMAMLVSMAAVISYFERFIPVLNIPGVKLGLANVVTLMALLLFSWKEAFLIAFARVLLVSFFGGGPVSLLYSATGALFSLIAMRLALFLKDRLISVVGVSIIGAVVHNTAQCMVLAIILKSFDVAWGYYPILIYTAVVTGFITGYICLHFSKAISYTPIVKKQD